VKVDFSRVVGQKRAKNFLSAAINSGDIASAYLFEGPEGIGKATLALEFAKALNCENPEVRPCNRCRTCRMILSFSHPDLIVLLPGNPEDWIEEMGEKGRIRPPSYDPAREISINQIRELKKELSKAPYEARYRVVLILNAENLSLEAQNAFLKTLEEPPPRTTFLLISSQPEKVLPTIISRARRVKFTPLDEGEFTSLDLGLKEKKLLFRLSGGSPGKALKLVELGFLDLRKYLLELLRTRKPEVVGDRILPAVQGTGSKGDLEAFFNVYQGLLRDLLLFKIGAGKELLTNQDLVSQIEKTAARVSAGEVSSLLETSFRVEQLSRKNTNRELLIYTLFRPAFDADQG